MRPDKKDLQDRSGQLVKLETLVVQVSPDHKVHRVVPVPQVVLVQPDLKDLVVIQERREQQVAMGLLDPLDRLETLEPLEVLVQAEVKVQLEQLEQEARLEHQEILVPKALKVCLARKATQVLPVQVVERDQPVLLERKVQLEELERLDLPEAQEPLVRPVSLVELVRQVLRVTKVTMVVLVRQARQEVQVKTGKQASFCCCYC